MELVVSRTARLARLMWYDGYGFHAGVAQLVEYLPSKQGVAGSSPVSRSKSLEFRLSRRSRPLRRLGVRAPTSAYAQIAPNAVQIARECGRMGG